jgi:hypothetical protein
MFLVRKYEGFGRGLSLFLAQTYMGGPPYICSANSMQDHTDICYILEYLLDNT